MPEQRYTIGEAVALLNVDRVTLKRWMDVENMRALEDPRDKRIRYLTRGQIEELARLHGKPIPDDATLGPRLTGVQRELIERMQEINADLLASNQHHEEIEAALLARIATLERALGRSESREPRENVPTPTESAEYVAPSESHYRASQAYRGTRLRPGEWDTLEPIPLGWIAPRRFAEEIGVPQRSFLHALRPRYTGDRERYGPLDYHEGRWKAPHPGTFATELLDEDQQEAARAWFAQRPRGQ